MTSKDLNDACDILVKLEQEFSSEEAKLSEISNEHAVRIDELDQQISTFRRNEDVDFRVFSPRNVATGVSDKIKALEAEKKQLEREKKDADKQLKYYSGKTDMISRVLSILKGDVDKDKSEENAPVRKSRNPFAFLDEDYDAEDSRTEEDEIDDVAELFKESPSPAKDEVKDTSEKKQKSATVTSGGVPVTEVERVCHKVEFCEKIISNDGIRAKLEIKNIAADLRDLVRAYQS